MDPTSSWQLKLFGKTLKKKEKLTIIRALLPDLQSKRCLDLGCAKGTISYFLAREGGIWFHEDLDLVNVQATRDLVGNRVAVIPPTNIPHPDGTFDIIVSLDILEHLREDRAFVSEMVRVLKPGGCLILSTPATGPVYLLNRLKNAVGLTPDQYGHVVEGYRLVDLKAMLWEAGLSIDLATTYSRFFTELTELMINLIFVKFLRKKTIGKRDGHITPGSADEVRKYAKQLTAYSMIYPFVWALTRLDRLLWWQKGYATLLRAYKRND